jgi:hypothetical protein
MEFLKSLWGLGTGEEESYRTGPPGYIGWRNSFLGIDSGAPYTFKNTGSACSTSAYKIQNMLTFKEPRNRFLGTTSYGKVIFFHYPSWWYQRKDLYIEHRAGKAPGYRRKMTQPGEFRW